MTKFYFFLLFIFSLKLLAIETTGAVSAATGGAGVGVLEDVDGVYLNPASIALFPKKSFAASFSKVHTNIHMTDNGRDALFPASLSYTKSDENGLQKQAYNLVLAYPLSDSFALGSAVSLRELKVDGIDEKYRQTLVSPGLFYQVIDSISMGLVWKNKELSDTDLADLLDKTSSVILGFSYIYEKFAKLRLDLETAENEKTEKMIYKVGLETFINDWIVTRFGYQNDNAHSLNFFTSGIGFVGPQFGLHYAYQSEARNSRDPLHTIDLNIPF